MPYGHAPAVASALTVLQRPHTGLEYPCDYDQSNFFAPSGDLHMWRPSWPHGSRHLCSGEPSSEASHRSSIISARSVVPADDGRSTDRSPMRTRCIGAIVVPAGAVRKRGRSSYSTSLRPNRRLYGAIRRRPSAPGHFRARLAAPFRSVGRCKSRAHRRPATAIGRPGVDADVFLGMIGHAPCFYRHRRP